MSNHSKVGKVASLFRGNAVMQNAFFSNDEVVKSLNIKKRTPIEVGQHATTELGKFLGTGYKQQFTVSKQIGDFNSISGFKAFFTFYTHDTEGHPVYEDQWRLVDGSSFTYTKNNLGIQRQEEPEGFTKLFVQATIQKIISSEKMLNEFLKNDWIFTRKKVIQNNSRQQHNRHKSDEPEFFTLDHSFDFELAILETAHRFLKKMTPALLDLQKANREQERANRAMLDATPPETVEGEPNLEASSEYEAAVEAFEQANAKLMEAHTTVSALEVDYTLLENIQIKDNQRHEERQARYRQNSYADRNHHDDGSQG